MGTLKKIRHLIKWTFSSKVSVSVQFSKVFRDRDSLSQNASISRLHGCRKSASIYVLCKYYYFTITICSKKYWLKCEIYTFSDKQSKSIKNSENILTKSSFEKNIHLKILTWLLDCPIWSNEQSISYHHNAFRILSLHNCHIF